MTPMTPEQALNILVECAAQAPLPNIVHDRWKQARAVLLPLVTAPKLQPTQILKSTQLPEEAGQ